MRQPLLTAVRVTGPMSARALPPPVPPARQIDHICAPERWEPKRTTTAPNGSATAAEKKPAATKEPAVKKPAAKKAAAKKIAKKAE